MLPIMVRARPGERCRALLLRDSGRGWLRTTSSFSATLSFVSSWPSRLSTCGRVR